MDPLHTIPLPVYSKARSSLKKRIITGKKQGLADSNDRCAQLETHCRIDDVDTE